jgi:3-phosphoglycerate kinase
MPTEIILEQDWVMTHSGIQKRAGTSIVFSNRSEEMKRIIDAGAGFPKAALPADMPGRSELMKAGYDSLQKLRSIEQWSDIKGIGPKTAKQLDNYFEQLTNEEHNDG